MSNLSWEVSELGRGFHISCVDNGKQFCGSGFAPTKKMAAVKALMELEERKLVHSLRGSDATRKDWKLDYDESASGFALGLTSKGAITRSLSEASERWVLSQWIDNKRSMEKLKEPFLDSASRKARALFSHVDFYHKEVAFPCLKTWFKFNVVASLAWTDDGVFAGYGTKTMLSQAIQHALIESSRNFLIASNQTQRSGFPFDRIFYFAKQRDHAEEIIDGIKAEGWRPPQLKFLKAQRFGNFWLSRSIFEGWTPWQLGDCKRFLY